MTTAEHPPSDPSRVVEIYRYPLKSARPERVTQATVDHGGLRGDRGWACLDDHDGTVGSAKHPRRWGRLLAVGARLLDEADPSALLVRVGGREVLAGTVEADATLSAFLGRPVRLSRQLPADPRLHRQLPDEPDMVPDWMSAAGPGQELVTAMSGPARVGRFVDFGAVHLVTTGALAALARRMGLPHIPAERFRPNLVLDAPGDPEPGQELRVGGAVLRVITPTPRCVVPGLAHGRLSADRALLGTLARHYRATVAGLGRAACFGVYAEVLRPGPLRLS